MDNETYSVEPVDETLSGRHRVYRESDSNDPTLRCGRLLSAVDVAMLLYALVSFGFCDPIKLLKTHIYTPIFLLSLILSYASWFILHLV